MLVRDLYDSYIQRYGKAPSQQVFIAAVNGYIGYMRSRYADKYIFDTDAQYSGIVSIADDIPMIPIYSEAALQYIFADSNGDTNAKSAAIAIADFAYQNAYKTRKKRKQLTGRWY